MTIILCIYTILLIFAFLLLIRLHLISNELKEYHVLVKNNEYIKALELLENNKFKMVFGVGRQTAMVYLYFLSNEYEKYKSVKEKCSIKDLKKNPDDYFSISHLFKITEIIFMYLHEDIENANTSYKELINNIEGTDKKLYYLDSRAWILFQIVKMIYSYYDNNYDEAKWIYECISTYAYNSTVKTIISYYICKIYEKEGNSEAIKAIISDIDIQNNPYRAYLDKWGAKQ